MMDPQTIKTNIRMKATGIPPPSSSTATATAMTSHSSLTSPSEQSYSQINSQSYSNSQSKSYSQSQTQSTSQSQIQSSEPNSTSTSTSRSSNVRVVVRIRPMNQTERDRHSKTSLYPVVMATDDATTHEAATTTEQSEAREMDENDPIRAAAAAAAAAAIAQEPDAAEATIITTPNGTPTRPRKSFLSRLLTPTRKSNFGYTKPTAASTSTSTSTTAAVKSYEQGQDDSSSVQNLFSEATPVVKNTTTTTTLQQQQQQHHSHSTIPQPQPQQRRVISHPLASIQTPPRQSSIPTATATAAVAAASSGKPGTNTNTNTPAAATVAVATRLMAESSTPCTNTNNHNNSSISNNSNINLTSNNKQFDFDAVFGPTASQATVYQQTVGDAVTRNIFRGFHTTIIAYGQTASGKTYTMGGPRDAKVLAGEAVPSPCTHQHQNQSQSQQQHQNQHQNQDDTNHYQVDPDDGIIPRAIHDLFQAKRNEQLSAGGGRQVTVELTYLEIYNDELRDLLVETDDGHANGHGVTNNANMTSPTPASNNNFLELRDHGDKVGVAVTGLTKLKVESVDQAKALMEQATLRRTTGSTRLNERSSRSHAICTLLVTIEQPPDGKSSGSANANGSAANNRTRGGGSETITAKLTLVDLAGSERIKETGVVGIQKQESININKDLFVLGKVVSALSEKAKKGKGSKTHVPYRDSKLTRLLRDSIGGNCCTVLIACVSPAENNVDESINTLRYAERSMSITNVVKQNVVQEALSPAECAALQAENKRLKANILQLQKRMVVDESKRSTSNLLDGGLSQDERSVDAGLSGLQAKLEMAKVEAKEAREHSRSVASTAGRWRDHFETMAKSSKIPSYNDTVLSPTLSLELSWTTSGDESPRDDDSYQSLNSKGRDTRYQKLDQSRLTADIETLLTQKLDLTDEHIKLSDQVESKEFQLSQLDQDLIRQKNELQEEVEKQHRKRDELEQEVRQMKLRIHLLSSDDSTGPQNFTSILRSLSADHSEHSQGDVEMHTMSESSNGTSDQITTERLTYLESVEKLLNEEKFQRSQLENRCHSLEQEMESNVIKKERLAHLETVEMSLTSEEARRSQLETRCLSLEKEMEANVLAQGQLAHFESVELELTEERTRRSDLESRCQSLEQELKSSAEEKEQAAHLKLCEENVKEEKDRLNQLETGVQEVKSAASDRERLAHLESVKKLLDDEKAQRSQLESRCQLLEQEKKSSVLEKKQELDRFDSVEKDLTEEKCLRSQLETRYQSLDHELKSAAREKGELSLQKETLLAEIQSLKAEIDSIREQATDSDSNEEPSSPCETEKTESSQDQKGGSSTVKTASVDQKRKVNGRANVDKENASETAEREKIRSHAEQMLAWADQAFEKRRGSMQSVCSSVASSIGTEFRPTPVQPAPLRAPQHSAVLKSGKPPKMPPRPKPQGDQQIVISNLENMDQIAGCTCETSAFSGNTEHVEFYLPKLGVACSCGKKKEPELVEGDNPCALEHILRPWQADFLASLGIKEAVDFVHAYNSRGYALAKDMRRWRRVKSLVSIKTKSCSIALHIWSRTCKSVVKAVQVQKANGVERLRRPDFMDVTIASDSCSVSTLGLGSHAGL